jgi:hypothetical protein
MSTRNATARKASSAAAAAIAIPIETPKPSVKMERARAEMYYGRALCEGVCVAHACDLCNDWHAHVIETQESGIREDAWNQQNAAAIAAAAAAEEKKKKRSTNATVATSKKAKTAANAAINTNVAKPEWSNQLVLNAVHGQSFAIHSSWMGNSVTLLRNSSSTTNNNTLSAPAFSAQTLFPDPLNFVTGLPSGIYSHTGGEELNLNHEEFRWTEAIAKHLEHFHLEFMMGVSCGGVLGVGASKQLHARKIGPQLTNMIDEFNSHVYNHDPTSHVDPNKEGPCLHLGEKCAPPHHLIRSNLLLCMSNATVPPSCPLLLIQPSSPPDSENDSEGEEGWRNDNHHQSKQMITMDNPIWCKLGPSLGRKMAYRSIFANHEFFHLGELITHHTAKMHLIQSLGASISAVKLAGKTGGGFFASKHISALTLNLFSIHLNCNLHVALAAADAGFVTNSSSLVDEQNIGGNGNNGKMGSLPYLIPSELRLMFIRTEEEFVILWWMIVYFVQSSVSMTPATDVFNTTSSFNTASKTAQFEHFVKQVTKMVLEVVHNNVVLQSYARAAQTDHYRRGPFGKEEAERYAHSRQAEFNRGPPPPRPTTGADKGSNKPTTMTPQQQQQYDNMIPIVRRVANSFFVHQHWINSLAIDVVSFASGYSEVHSKLKQIRKQLYGSGSSNEKATTTPSSKMNETLVFKALPRQQPSTASNNSSIASKSYDVLPNYSATACVVMFGQIAQFELNQPSGIFSGDNWFLARYYDYALSFAQHVFGNSTKIAPATAVDDIAMPDVDQVEQSDDGFEQGLEEKLKHLWSFSSKGMPGRRPPIIRTCVVSRKFYDQSAVYETKKKPGQKVTDSTCTCKNVSSRAHTRPVFNSVCGCRCMIGRASDALNDHVSLSVPPTAPQQHNNKDTPLSPNACQPMSDCEDNDTTSTSTAATIGKNISTNCETEVVVVATTLLTTTTAAKVEQVGTSSITTIRMLAVSAASSEFVNITKKQKNWDASLSPFSRVLEKPSSSSNNASSELMEWRLWTASSMIDLARMIDRVGNYKDDNNNTNLATTITFDATATTHSSSSESSVAATTTSTCTSSSSDDAIVDTTPFTLTPTIITTSPPSSENDSNMNMVSVMLPPPTASQLPTVSVCLLQCRRWEFSIMEVCGEKALAAACKKVGITLDTPFGSINECRLAMDSIRIKALSATSTQHLYERTMDRLDQLCSRLHVRTHKRLNFHQTVAGGVHDSLFYFDFPTIGVSDIRTMLSSNILPFDNTYPMVEVFGPIIGSQLTPFSLSREDDNVQKRSAEPFIQQYFTSIFHPAVVYTTWQYMQRIISNPQLRPWLTPFNVISVWLCCTQLARAWVLEPPIEHSMLRALLRLSPTRSNLLVWTVFSKFLNFSLQTER